MKITRYALAIASLLKFVLIRMQSSEWFCVLLLVVVGQALAVPAWAQEPIAKQIVLIRNVNLVTSEVDSDSASVSILIKAGKLDVITRDIIPRSEATLVLNARNGYLIGRLGLGEPASFLILDKDPRKRIDVLLDTRTHVGFAIHEGEILRNTLSVITEPDPLRRSGWLAYTPPPMALPLSYRDESKWNRWETRYVSGIFLAAILLDRQRWLSQNTESEEQIGDLTEFDGGEVRGFRFGAVGTLNFPNPWVYTVFGATSAYDRGYDADEDNYLTLFDYRLDIPLLWKTTLSVGKQKEPISMERIVSLIYTGMQERSSASDALLPSRNVGLVLTGTGFGQRMTWAGGAFNDWFDSGESFNESASQFVARVTTLAAVSEDQSNLFHVGGSVRVTDAKEGVRYSTEPEFNLAPPFVDTGDLTPESATTLNAELTWRKGTLWVAGEYTRSSLDAPTLGNPSFSGYHFSGWWTATGEMRPYNRQAGVVGPIPVSRSVYQGGWGTWELGASWSEIDLTEGTVDGGEMSILSLGLNWWLTPFFAVGLDYRHIVLDRFGSTGHSDGLCSRLVLALE